MGNVSKANWYRGHPSNSWLNTSIHRIFVTQPQLKDRLTWLLVCTHFWHIMCLPKSGTQWNCCHNLTQPQLKFKLHDYWYSHIFDTFCTSPKSWTHWNYCRNLTTKTLIVKIYKFSVGPILVAGRLRCPKIKIGICSGLQKILNY